MTVNSLLRDRVDAAATLAAPESTAELWWRPASDADVDAILNCARAIDEVDHPHFVTTREEIEEELAHSYVSAEHDSLLAVDKSGKVLGYGVTILNPGQETAVQSILIGGVRPTERGKGIGRQLLAWQEARALQQFAGSDKALPGWMVLWVNEPATDAVRLAERAGFRIARYFLQLNRDLGDHIEPRILDGFEIVQFDGSRSEAARLAKNDAFRDHWGSQPVSEERWNQMVARSTFRPDLSLLAVAPNGDIAGFVISEVNEEDFAPQGFSSAYLGLVGVPRAYRGRGIAPALLTSTLQTIAAAGLEKAVLDVDAESPTGALGLYTGVGFVEANRSLQLNKVF